MKNPFKIVFILYPRVTQLDFTGPYEVLSRMPGAEVIVASKDGGALSSETGLTFANLRALAAGTKTADLLAIAADFRKRHPAVPLVLMGYANPMVRRGPDWFADHASAAGVDGVICVDLPPEEDAELGPALRGKGIDFIRLATPTSDAKRLETILDGASGFLYYVSVAGITGLQQAAQASIDEAVARLKAATDIPVVVGFGVRTPDQARAIGRVADGVVVGSAIVELVGEHGVAAAGPVRDYVSGLATAIRAGQKENAA